MEKEKIHLPGPQGPQPYIGCGDTGGTVHCLIIGEHYLSEKSRGSTLAVRLEFSGSLELGFKSRRPSVYGFALVCGLLVRSGVCVIAIDPVDSLW